MLLVALCYPWFPPGYQDPPLEGLKFVASILLFLNISEEATTVSPNRKITTFAFWSAFPAFVIGLLVSFYLLPLNSLNLWVMGCAFCLSAMTILSLWMKEFNIPMDEQGKALQSVAWVDTVAWVGLGFLLSYQKLAIGFVIIGVGLLALYIFRKASWWWFFVLYAAFYGWFESQGGHGLMWALCAVYAWKRFGGALMPKGSFHQMIKWVVVPVVLVFGFSKINVKLELEWSIVALLIVLPLISKSFSIWLAQKKTQLLDGRFPWTVLINARGMAELVFLSTAFSAGALDSKVYTLLVVMSVIGTILPLFWLRRNQRA